MCVSLCDVFRQFVTYLSLNPNANVVYMYTRVSFKPKSTKSVLSLPIFFTFNEINLMFNVDWSVYILVINLSNKH